MNKSKRTETALLAIGLSLAIFPPAIGQDDTEEVFELSPFSVDGSEDEGYRATTTLAGTRLKTQLRDVGSAISVLTEEFFEDTGATDADTVLSYALNMEVSGVQGNFANTAPSNDGRVNTANARSSSQTAQRVRGLAEAQLTRGFFLTNIPFDSYNTSSVTINRGPNSLLFGVGTPGGVIDNGVKIASSSKDFGEVSFRLGERGSNRFSFDYNKTLIEGRLGLRIAGLNERNEYEQRPAFEDDQRIYIALNATLLKNENSDFLGAMRLRANYESGTIEGTPPNIIPLNDSVSSWWSLPENVSQIAQIGNWDGRGITAPGYIDSFSPQYTVDNRAGNINSGTFYSSIGPNEIPMFIQMPYTYTDSTAATPSVGLANAAIAGVQPRVRWGASSDPNKPAGQKNSELFSVEHFLGKNRVQVLAPGFSYPVIQDRGIYDNTSLLLSGNAAFRNQDFDAFNVAVDQTFLDGKAGIEVAFDKQSYRNESYLPFSDAQFTDLRIDISEYLANGQANPNVGRAFIFETGTANHPTSLTDRKAMNATAFYSLKLSENDNWSKWMGDHTLTSFYSSQKIDGTSWNHRNTHVDIAGNGTNVRADMNGTVEAFRRSIPIQVYMTPDLRGANSVTDISITDYFRGNTPQPGDIVTQQYSNWSPLWGTNTNRILTNDFMVDEFLIGGGRNRQEIDSEVFSLQSRWLDGNIVGLVGWRSDEQTSTGQITPGDYQDLSGVVNYRLPDGVYDAGAIRLDPNAGSVETGDTVTWSLVGHLPENISLPGNIGLSAHYNESENFSATGVRRDFDGNALPSPSGTTTEYGITMTTAGGKLSARLNFFETNNGFASVADPGFSFPSWINGGMVRYKDDEVGLLADGLSSQEALAASLQRSVDFRPESLSIDGLLSEFPTWDALYAEMLTMLPSAQSSRFEGFDGTGAPIWTPNPGQSVVQSFVSEGIELDIVGSLTKNWSVALNVGQQETVTSNSAQYSAEFVRSVLNNIKGSTLQYLIDSPVQNEAETFLDRWTRQQFNPMNALVGKDGQVSAEQRKYRANFVTNYRFTEGAFKGYSVGGALRWQGKVATGYKIEVDNDGVIIPNLNSPFWGPDELNGDVWLGYSRRFRDKIDWKVQLNIRNLIRDSGYIPVITNPDGNVAVVRNPNPQEIFLTNTFSF